MSINIDVDFLSEISNHLPQFKWKIAGKIAQCRCILCGDSSKDSTKTRGFFYYSTNGTSLQYKCHNCGETMSFGYFLKTKFPESYKEYRLAKFKSCNNFSRSYSNKKNMTGPTYDSFKSIGQMVNDMVTKLAKREWTMVSELDVFHPARTYCFGRGLNTDHMSKIVFTENFKKWSDENIGETDSKPPPLPFLLFPFMEKDGTLFGAQGRVFTESIDKRYRFNTVIKKNSIVGKSFGLERLDVDRPVIIVEGVIDSLLLPNCIALCGGDVNSSFKNVAGEIVVALDNENRSTDTVNRMARAIDLGFSIVLWPFGSHLKDINDMVKFGMSVEDIMQVINNNTYSGNRAKTKLQFWKKV